MKRNFLLIMISLSMFLTSCTQESDVFGPGYRWELFKNTNNWRLAKAVEAEDTSEISRLIKTGKFNINLQEPKFRRSLLMLAVGNDKEKSTEALLKAGADINLKDVRDDQAIHEAVQFIGLKNHALNILKQLLKYGADASAVSLKGSCEVPMACAIESIECSKLLIDYKADVYYRTRDSDYVVWSRLCSQLADNIYVARYLIVEKKMPVPNPILYTLSQHQPSDIFQLIELSNFSADIKKLTARNEIVEYLYKIGFPKNNVYKEN